MDIDEAELPCLLTTGVEVETHRIEVKGRLAIKTWAETADFQAEQSYWTTRYQKQIDAGDEFLKPRLDDYANELRLAEKMYFKAGDRLPVSFENDGTLCVGCLILDAIDGCNFEGQLFTNLKFIDAKIQLERNVPSDDGKQIRQIITSDLHCLSD